MQNLPSVKAVAEAKNLDELQKLLGPRLGGFSSWGDGNRSYGTAGGIWFRQEGKERLRYLSVFAHVSYSDKNAPADIDILKVTEGLFRPANPKSNLEKQQFKTGAEVNAAYEARRREARAKYPLPLRSLVEARETPDDSDLSTYKGALNDVRRNPSPELFRQFAQWMHEGTLQIRGILESILFDRHLKLDPWAQPQKKIALKALANALPDVKTNMDLDHLLVYLLRAQGGGEFQLHILGTNAQVDVMADVVGGARYGSQNVSDEVLVTAGQQCRDAIKERYPDLR